MKAIAHYHLIHRVIFLTFLIFFLPQVISPVELIIFVFISLSN